jgi:hypothetical protein
MATTIIEVQCIECGAKLRMTNLDHHAAQRARCDECWPKFQARIRAKAKADPANVCSDPAHDHGVRS